MSPLDLPKLDDNFCPVEGAVVELFLYIKSCAAMEATVYLREM